MNSRKLIIPLIIIIAVLSIALIGTVILVLTNKSNNAAQNQGVIDVNKTQNVLNENTKNETNENTNLSNESQNSINNNETNTNTNTDTNTNTNEVLPIGSQDDNNQIVTPGTSEDDMEKMLFNSKFMSYFGDITGTQLAELIQLAREVSASSTSTQPHSISFTSNNLQVIDGILATDVYTISFGYDGNGYINTINIDKKM